MPAGDNDTADAPLVELLWAAEEFRGGNERPSGSGIPILFPFPGRIGGAKFRYDGREYELEPADGLGNAIHGFAYTRPWRVLRQEANLLEAQFTASLDDPVILKSWPGDFQITATYSIAAGELTLRLRMENPGETPCPWGLGLHPYFRLPVGRLGDLAAGKSSEGGAAGDCTLQVPVGHAWELQDMLPTGHVVAASAIEGVGAKGGQAGGDLAAGVRLEEGHLDDVFAGVNFVDGVATSRIQDGRSGRTIRVSWSEVFRECVLYTPGHREAVCVEPYTCVPDAYRLEELGSGEELGGTGLRVLAPGESAEAWMKIALE